MNFLAHLYLSGSNPEIKTGNFIADWIKGSAYKNYPENIQKGIIIHRNIDTFTDKNPLTHRASDLLKPVYHKYAGIIIDVLFDHFLARDWHNYSPKPISIFTKETYLVLKSNYNFLPYRVQSFLPNLIDSNRLKSYEKVEGIRTALEIMSNYTSLPDETDFAIEVLQKHNTELENYFVTFFDEICTFVSENYNISDFGT